jgi:hypothetical protein
MTNDAPERIWIDNEPYEGRWHEGSAPKHERYTHVFGEYVRADLASPLAAIAMREAAAGWHDAQITKLQQQIAWNDERSARLGVSAWNGNTVCNDAIAVHREAAKAIRAIPLPDDAQILAAALAVPEVARLVEAASRASELIKRYVGENGLSGDLSEYIAALKGAAE